MRMLPYPTITRLLLLILWLMHAEVVSAATQQQEVDESQIRAMMIVSLTKFIDWPPASSDLHSPFVLCAVGNEAVGADLETALAGKTIKGRTVVIRRGMAQDQAEGCHILYVAHPKHQLNESAVGLAKASVLTISEERQARSGTVIGLPLVDGRVQIEINRPLAQLSRLALSSQLLHIAEEGR